MATWAGCGDAASNSQASLNSQTVRYECAAGEKFAIQFTPDMLAFLTLPDGRRVQVDQAESASGAKYTDGSVTYWSKGRDATLEFDGKTLDGCRQAQ